MFFNQQEKSLCSLITRPGSKANYIKRAVLIQQKPQTKEKKSSVSLSRELSQLLETNELLSTATTVKKLALSIQI